MTRQLWQHNTSGEVYLYDTGDETLYGPMHHSEYRDEAGLFDPSQLQHSIDPDKINDSQYWQEQGDYDPDDYHLYAPYR